MAKVAHCWLTVVLHKGGVKVSHVTRIQVDPAHVLTAAESTYNALMTGARIAAPKSKDRLHVIIDAHYIVMNDGRREETFNLFGPSH